MTPSSVSTGRTTTSSPPSSILQTPTRSSGRNRKQVIRPGMVDSDLIKDAIKEEVFEHGHNIDSDDEKMLVEQEADDDDDDDDGEFGAGKGGDDGSDDDESMHSYGDDEEDEGKSKGTKRPKVTKAMAYPNSKPRTNLKHIKKRQITSDSDSEDEVAPIKKKQARSKMSKNVRDSLKPAPKPVNIKTASPKKGLLLPAAKLKESKVAIGIPTNSKQAGVESDNQPSEDESDNGSNKGGSRQQTAKVDNKPKPKPKAKTPLLIPKAKSLKGEMKPSKFSGLVPNKLKGAEKSASKIPHTMGSAGVKPKKQKSVESKAEDNLRESSGESGKEDEPSSLQRKTTKKMSARKRIESDEENSEAAEKISTEPTRSESGRQAKEKIKASRAKKSGVMKLAKTPAIIDASGSESEHENAEETVVKQTMEEESGADSSSNSDQEAHPVAKPKQKSKTSKIDKNVRRDYDSSTKAPKTKKSKPDVKKDLVENDAEDEMSESDGEQKSQPKKSSQDKSSSKDRSQTPIGTKPGKKTGLAVEKITPEIRATIMRAFATPAFTKHVNFGSIAVSFEGSTTCASGGGDDQDVSTSTQKSKLARHWREVLSGELIQYFEKGTQGKAAKRAGGGGGNKNKGGALGVEHRKAIWHGVSLAYEYVDWKAVQGETGMEIAKLKRHFREVMKRDAEKYIA